MVTPKNTDIESANRASAIARLLPWLVFVAAVACAALLYLRFLQTPRLLWSDGIHDRNAHLYPGLCLAMDVRLFDLRHLIPDLDSFRTWPPLHDGLLVGAALLLGGGDVRWAVLPSLAAWVGTAVFAFLLARRCSRTGGIAAGLFAALFVLVSPAQRAFATDVMIESTGACLSVACLYCYVVARQERTPIAFRRLAISLTLLFLTKYNYWLLVLLGMLADRIAADPKLPLATAQAWAKSFDARRWISGQMRSAGSWFVLLVLAIAAVLALTGGIDLRLFGKASHIKPSPNLVTIVYAVCSLRLIPWYRRCGRTILARSNEEVRAFAAWHLWPMALWFLWPYHLFAFLWFLDPAANAGEHPQHNLLGGYTFYWNSFAHDYQANIAGAGVAIALFLIALWAGKTGRLRPGVSAIFWFVAIALALTVHHQNQKSRFLHSWVPLVWVGAGIGAGALAPDSRKRGSSLTRFGFGAAACAIGVAQMPGITAAAHAPDGGIHSDSRSILDVTDAYLPDFAESRHAAVFSNLPVKFLAQWTYLARYHRTQRLETDARGFDFSARDNRACLTQWVATTDCDTVVCLDFPPSSPFYSEVAGCESLPQYLTVMETQTRFALARRQTLPQHACTISVWKRATPENAPGIPSIASPTL